MSTRDELIVDNMGLVYHVCAKYKGSKKWSWDDLCQIGMLGLISAADTYDSSKQCAFSTYACKCIAMQLSKACLERKKDTMVRCSIDAIEHADQEVTSALLGSDNTVFNSVLCRQIRDFVESNAVTKKERYVFNRVLILGEKQVTVAKHLGVSTSAVSALKSSVCRKIRTQLLE